MEFVVEGKICVVDDQDWEWIKETKLSLSKKCDGRQQYLLINGVMAHKLIFALKGVELKPGYVIDHRNRKTLDDKRSNLRPLTNHENRYLNKRKFGGNGSSKFIGVSKNKPTGEWRAQSTTNGLNTYLGLFKSEREAALAHDIHVIKNFKNPIRLNFPDLVEVLKEIINAKYE